MKFNSSHRAPVSVVVMALIAGSSFAAADDTVDPHALYVSRADSVELSDLGVVISHVEGTVTIASGAREEAPNFFVIQEMDAHGRVQFVGFAPPGEDYQVGEIIGTLMILPDGSLHVEYDAWNFAAQSSAGSVTKFAISGAVILLKKVCRCEDPNMGGCSTGPCNDGAGCSQSTAIPREKCGWFDDHVIVQPTAGA